MRKIHVASKRYIMYAKSNITELKQKGIHSGHAVHAGAPAIKKACCT